VSGDARDILHTHDGRWTYGWGHDGARIRASKTLCRANALLYSLPRCFLQEPQEQ
jgi:hypothetical protein